MHSRTILIVFAGVAALGAMRFVQSQIPPGQMSVPPTRLSRQIQGTLGGSVSLNLSEIVGFTEWNNQLFVARKNSISEVAADGSVLRSHPTQVERPSISPFGSGKLIVGNLANRQVGLFDTKSGQMTPMLSLAEVQSPNDGEGPPGQLLGTGEFSAVASDGIHVYAAVKAGFSSAIFKIDPASKRVVAKSFATADDPEAMVFHDGSLFVLAAEGSQVRRFTSALEKSHDHIELPVSAGKGLGIRSGEIRTLTQNRTRVSTVKVGAQATSNSTIGSNLDRIRLRNLPELKSAAPAVAQVKRYAVLITGDLAENMAGELFWNDTVWLYRTLIQCGYAPADVFVLYGDGVDFNTLNPTYKYPGTVTDFAATAANVNLVLDGLKNGNPSKGIPKMDANDTLFFWTFDHGGLSGSESTLCLRGPDMTESQLCPKLNALPYAQRAIFMQQCFSGGFIDPLKNSKTFISTACKADETAHVANNEKEVYLGRTYKHGEFNYWIIRAMNKLPGGGIPKPDLNSDTYISGKEMHVWNVLKEDMSETPQFADLGTVGTTFKFKK